MSEPNQLSTPDLIRFGERISEGLFGTTYYRGEIHPRYHIPYQGIVKVFNDRNTWERERYFLKKFQHKNVVELINSAADHPKGEYYLVIPDYQNGTLGQKLPDLKWHETKKILKGIAMALKYLHTHFNPYIVHSELQPKHILLDEKYNAKISNFEDAIEGGQPKGNATRLPIGYTDPSAMEFNPTTDIYSLGIIMLQLITKEPCSSVQNELKNKSETKIPKRRWEGTNFVVHESLLSTGCNAKKAEFIINLALNCVDKNPKNRPTAAVVVDKLDDVDANFQILRWLQNIIVSR